MRHFQIVIIGSGPAGMACALQLKRMGLEPVIIEREVPRSMLKMANRVENYLGFPGGIRGEDLYKLFMEQLESFQVEYINKEVRKIYYQDELFVVDVYDEEISCEVLVIASGTRPIRAIIPTWNEAVAKYLHYDISGIPRQSDLSVGIIGLGDAAIDYALNLNQRGHQVSIFGRSEKLIANKSLMDQFRRSTGINLNLNHMLVSVDELVEGKINCRFRKNEHQVDYKLDCLIFATGREAAMDFLDEGLTEKLSELKENKRLYFAGDVKNGDYRQTSIAAGDGIRVAMEIFKNEGNSENGT